MTHAADKLKETGPEIPHLWIYENTPTLDLDFYLHLTQAIKLRVSDKHFRQPTACDTFCVYIVDFSPNMVQYIPLNKGFTLSMNIML